MCAALQVVRAFRPAEPSVQGGGDVVCLDLSRGARSAAGATAADAHGGKASPALLHRNLETDGPRAERRQGRADESESRAEVVRIDGEGNPDCADDPEQPAGS